MSQVNNTISYVEFPLSDTEGTRNFFSSVFGWELQDWGPDYLGFSGAGVHGGFNRERPPATGGAGPLIVLFAADLDKKIAEVKAAGREISREIYEFPGGRRFHFIDPNGSEIAVWGEPAGE